MNVCNELVTVVIKFNINQFNIIHCLNPSRKKKLSVNSYSIFFVSVEYFYVISEVQHPKGISVEREEKMV